MQEDAKDAGLIPGLRLYPAVGNDNPLPYSCLGNTMNRGAWQATVHGVTKSWTWLNDWAHTSSVFGSKVCLLLCGSSRQAWSQHGHVHSLSLVKPSPMGSSRLHEGQDIGSSAWRRRNEFEEEPASLSHISESKSVYIPKNHHSSP